MFQYDLKSDCSISKRRCPQMHIKLQIGQQSILTEHKVDAICSTSCIKNNVFLFQYEVILFTQNEG